MLSLVCTPSAPIHTEALYRSTVGADTFIQKTKKLYMDTRTQRNMAKLTEDISEVHSIMTKNIQDVLNHGERLDSKCVQWRPLFSLADT